MFRILLVLVVFHWLERATIDFFQLIVSARTVHFKTYVDITKGASCHCACAIMRDCCLHVAAHATVWYARTVNTVVLHLHLIHYRT